MIELKITGDALEVKSEIEKLFNMTSGTVPVSLPTTEADDDAIDRLIDKIPNMFPKGEMKATDEPMPSEEDEEVPEFDKRGMPWDERIHASSKSINADGTWRNKRGIDKETLESIEQELLSVTEQPETVTEQPETALAEPPAEVTFKDVQGALVKAISGMKDVKDADGVPAVSKFPQKLMAKFKVSNINELVNQEDRSEFVEVCNNIISAPDQWETFL